MAYPAYDPKLLQPKNWAVLPNLIQPFWFPSFFWASWLLQLVPLSPLSLPPRHMSKDHRCTLDSSRCPCLQLCSPPFFLSTTNLLLHHTLEQSGPYLLYFFISLVLKSGSSLVSFLFSFFFSFTPLLCSWAYINPKPFSARLKGHKYEDAGLFGISGVDECLCKPKRMLIAAYVRDSNIHRQSECRGSMFTSILFENV